MALTAVVAAAALGGLVGLQRRAVGEAERQANRASLRTAAQVLHVELGNVDPAAGDLVVAATDRMTYRAIRGNGVGCGLAMDGVVVRTSSWRSLRVPVPGRDSVMLLRTGPVWLLAALDGPVRAAICPDGSPGLAFPVTGVTLADTGTAVRTFEQMELRLYLSGGTGWLGMRSVSGGETIQPVAGPFDSSPAPFTWYDSAGTAVTMPVSARRLRAVFRGVTRVDAAAGAAARADLPRRDSLETVVALRGGSPP
jgi:hypothetical protein